MQFESSHSKTATTIGSQRPRRVAKPATLALFGDNCICRLRGRERGRLELSFSMPLPKGAVMRRDGEIKLLPDERVSRGARRNERAHSA